MERSHELALVPIAETVDWRCRPGGPSARSDGFDTRCDRCNRDGKKSNDEARVVLATKIACGCSLGFCLECAHRQEGDGWCSTADWAGAYHRWHTRAFHEARLRQKRHGHLYSPTYTMDGPISGCSRCLCQPSMELILESALPATADGWPGDLEEWLAIEGTQPGYREADLRERIRALGIKIEVERFGLYGAIVRSVDDDMEAQSSPHFGTVEEALLLFACLVERRRKNEAPLAREGAKP